MTNAISEVEGNEVLFIIGSNATEAHPIIGNKMKRAAMNGSKLIVIDPRRTELAEYATLWLPLKSGTDVALINGIMRIIVKEGWHDKEFIEARCDGFEELLKAIEKYTPEYVSKITGISEEMLYETAKLYSSTKKAGIFYTLGITEHITGTDNVMSLANLAMLVGHLGIENAGINPIRGQNNVQGACDMGALPNVFSGYQSVTVDKNIEFFEDFWKFKLNRNVGLKIPEMFDGSHEGTVKAMYIMGEDPVLTDPDANHVRKALEKLDFLVVQDIFLSETAKLADIVLPAACYAEKEGTFTNTERRVQMVRKAVEAPGEARPDWEIICDLAKGLGADGFDYNNAEDIFKEIAATTPSYRGMTYARMDKNGLQWPCPTEEHPGTQYLHKGTFPKGKALMKAIEYKLPAEEVCEDYPILLSTGRMLYHYNITTRFSDKLDSIRPYELAEINPVDAEKLDLKEEDFVRMTSRRGSIVTRVTITKKVKPGMMSMTFHYRESPANELTNSAFDPATKTGEYKISAVKVEKVKDMQGTAI